MPTLKEQTIINLGMDPQEWDLDDQDNIIRKVKSQPSFSPTPLNPQSPQLPQPTQDTPLQTFGKSAAMSAIPTFAGGGGAAVGAAIGTPIAGPFGTIGGGIIGAILASITARKAQEAILPNDLLANVAASQAANPKSAIAGSLATMPLGGFNPSIKNLAGIPKLIAGVGLKPIEKAALMNVALGTGIGAAQPIAESAIHGELPSLTDVALGAGTGALFSQPNVIGRHVFRFGVPQVEGQGPGLEDVARVGSHALSTGMPAGERVKAYGIPSTRGLKVIQNKSGVPTLKSAGDTMAKYRQNLESTESAMATMEGEGGIAQDVPYTNPKIEAFEQATREKAAQDLQAQKNAKAELDRQEAAALASENAERALSLQNQLRANQLRTGVPETRTKPLATTELGRDIMPDYTGVTEQANLETGVESPADLAARQTEARLSGQERPQYSEEPAIETGSTMFSRSINERIGAEGISGKPTKDWRDKFVKLAVHRNAEMREDGTIVNAETGHPVAGQASFDKVLKRYLIKLHPEKAALDTEAHELAHVFLAQLRASGKPRDIEFVRKFEKLVSDSPEFQAINAERSKPENVAKGMKPWTPEEFIAHEQGVEYLARNLKLRGETGLKEYWKDLWSHIKERFGKATPEEYRRILQYRTQYDKSTPISGMRTEVAVAPQNQEDAKNGFRKDEKSGHMIYEPTAPIPEMMPDERLVVVVKPDGSTYQAAFSGKYYEHPERGMVESIGRIVNGKWSHGMLGKGERILKGNENATQYSEEPAIKQVKIKKAPEFEEFGNYEVTLPSGKKTFIFRDKDTMGGWRESLDGKYDFQPKILGWNKKDAIEALLKRDREGDIQYSEDPAIKRQKGEGKTPYPFTTKDLARSAKAEDVQLDKVMDLEHGLVLKEEGAGALDEDYENYEREDAKLTTLGDINDYGQRKRRKELLAKNTLNQDEPAISRRSSFLPALTSRIDKIDETLTKKSLPETVRKTARYVTDTLHKFLGDSDIQSSKIGNRLIAATRGTNETSIDRVYRYLHQVDDKGSSVINLSPKEKALADKIVSILREPRQEQIKLGLMVKQGQNNFRVAGIKPEGYMFNILDPKVAYTWAEKPNSADAKAYDKAFVDHQISKGETEADAKALLTEYKKALGNNNTQDVEFGALRKAEGNGLPWELVDKNFASASARYGRRAGKDLAYFKWIQNDPKMRKALSLKDQFGDLPKDTDNPETEYIGENEAVKEAIRSVRGLDVGYSPGVASAARVVNNSMMGVGTSARNILGMPAQIATYVQLKQLPLVAKAFAHLNESRVRAFENGATRASFADYDAAGYYEGSPNPVIRMMNRLSDFMRKYQGRNLSDKFEGEYFYSLGELLAVDNIARAKNGDKEAKRFLDRFGDVAGGTDKILKLAKVDQDTISSLAKRFVDASRGTYGAEGLPSWALEGPLAPFTALSRWSIEKSNTVWKDVIEPARQGIYGPLLRYVLGAAGAGALVESMNELLSNKRGGEPTINEVLKSGSKGDLLAKAISTMQLAAFAGVVSDGAQLVSSAMRGKGLKYNNPLSFPLYTWLTDTMAGNVSGAVNAIKEGEDPFETLAKFVTSVATQSVQTARYVDNNFIHPDEAKRKERFRDYNIWQELTDLKEPEPVMTDTASAYKNLGVKEFKRETDLSKAGQQLKSLISRAVENSKTAAGYVNVEKLRREFRTIKQNNYQTMPDPESFPANFMEYVSHLRNTQGNEAATERIMDYMKQKGLNKVKSSMVPSI